MKLSENFPDFTYEVYTSIGCYELISDNHPRKIMDQKESRRHEISDPYMPYLKENEKFFSSENELDPNKEIIVQCKSGKRSARVCEFLLKNSFTNVKNLKGGILEWAKYIDPSIIVY